MTERQAQVTAGRDARKTVLFLHHGRDWVRGSERCLLDLAAGLDPAEFRAILLCNAERVVEAARERGIDARLAHGWLGSGERLLPSRAEVSAVWRVARAEGVDLIHANGLLPVKAATVVARSLHVPLVAHLHLSSGEEERRYTGLHQATMIVGVSEHAVTGVRRDGVPAERVRVIHNGVDRARLLAGEPTLTRAALGWDHGERIVTAITSLIEIKGIDTLLDAFVLVRRTQPAARLLVVGDGPHAATYAARARELGLDDVVRFVGERRDVGFILRDATDIVAAPSRMEAFPLNVLEAGVMGRPVVASDIAPHAEAIVDGVTGLLYATDDAGALAERLGALLADETRARTLGEAARQHVTKQFSLARYLEQFHSLYRELVGRRRVSHGWLGASRWPASYTAWLARALGRRLRRRPAR